MLCRGSVLLGATLLIAAAAHAGDQTNIRGLGMARATTASSRGLDAVGVNPANLALSDEANVEFSLVPVGIGLGSDFMTYALYNKFFTGVETPTGRMSKNLSDADKQEILDAFPGGSGGSPGERKSARSGSRSVSAGWGRSRSRRRTGSARVRRYPPRTRGSSSTG